MCEWMGFNATPDIQLKRKYSGSLSLKGIVHLN